MTILPQILSVLTPRERRQLFALIPLVILTGLFEVAGVASIAPLLSVMTAPGSAESNTIVNVILDFTGVQSETTAIFVLGCLVLATLLVSNGVAAVTYYWLFRFGFMRNHSLSHRLLVHYLGKPYSFYISRNSAEMVNNVLQEVMQVISGVLVPFLQLVAKGVAALFIVALLLLIDPFLALIVTFVLGGSYALLYSLFRSRLNRYGAERLKANEARMKAVHEAIGGLKELRLRGREGEAARQYYVPSRKFAVANAKSNILGVLPRYALEAVAFGAMIVIILVLLARGNPPESILPVVGVYAFAGYRLLPALQMIFRSMTQIRFSHASLDSVASALADIEGMLPTNRKATNDPLRLSDSLRVEGLSFRYPGSKATVLQEVNLTIEAGSWVAFVGETGSGKSTLLDILLGLLEPDSGSVFIDNVQLSAENKQRWQLGIGYVPQQIYLADSSVAQNIAFGVPVRETDFVAVQRAAEVAQLDGFIRSLPGGYNTVVGEQGVTLSGGQRQRMAIARALYDDPDVLVLDEATSALDNLTEMRVFENLREVAKAKTVLMVAHRLSTVERCDQIFVLKQGRIAASGTYSQLMTTSSEFRRMVEHNSPTVSVSS